MAAFSLSTLGFAPLEEQALHAVLTLSERALSESWTYIQDSINVDVVLVSLNNVKGMEFWQSRLQDYPSVSFVACSDNPGLDAPWKLSMSPAKLPSRRELVELLNALSEHSASRPPVEASDLREPGQDGPSSSQPLAPPPEIQAEPQPTAGATQPEEEAPPPPAPVLARPAPQQEDRPSTFDPARHFLGLLQESVAASREVLFVLPGNTWLAVSPQAQRYYTTSSAEGLLPLLQAGAGAIQVRDLNIEKMLASPMGQETLASPLGELIWHATLASSGGRLLVNRQAEDVVRLKHWPQVAHLPSYRKFLRLAAFMNHNAASLESIADHTGTPLADVFDFHNACEALGLLERHVQPELVKKPTEGLVKDLYRKISTRLARPRPEDKAS